MADGVAIRPATLADLPVLTALMDRAIRTLQQPFLTPTQVTASRAVMGLDTQLIRDGSYFVATLDGSVTGCGGWSRRATLYGGDHSAGRDARLLDPAHEPARVRAMYTDPDFARRGIGRAVIAACEDAARAAGFGAVELMATLSGAALYRTVGYAAVEAVTDTVDGVGVPLIRMRKALGVAPGGAGS